MIKSIERVENSKIETIICNLFLEGLKQINFRIFYELIDQIVPKLYN